MNPREWPLVMVAMAIFAATGWAIGFNAGQTTERPCIAPLRIDSSMMTLPIWQIPKGWDSRATTWCARRG